MVERPCTPLDQVFQALSDPTRRAILARLSHGSASVGELAGPFPTSLNAISKHLRVLERAGLLTRRIEGRVHHCALEPGPLAGAAEWIAFYRRFWDARLDALDTWLTASQPSHPLRPHHAPVRKRRR